MKKFALSMIILSVFLINPGVSVAAKQENAYPKPNDQERLERRSAAYKKSLGQAANEKSADPVCYYTMSGCSEEQQKKDANFKSEGRPPLQYPKQGYLLGGDGLYHFNPGAMSRK